MGAELDFRKELNSPATWFGSFLSWLNNVRRKRTQCPHVSISQFVSGLVDTAELLSCCHE